MAPKAKQSPEDFVLTISDTEDAPNFEESSDEELGKEELKPEPKETKKAGKKAGKKAKKQQQDSEEEKEKEKENENERENEKEKESKAAAAAGAPDTPPADIFATFADGDGELLQALRDYDRMRKEKRKSLTDTMRRSLCQQLDEEFHRCEWTEVVKQATRQGWLKFYPLDKDKPPSTVPEFESAGDQISRIIENLKRKNGA